MRWCILAMVVSGCAPEVLTNVDLTYAVGRAPRQTYPSQIHVLATDIAQPYDVLGDVQVTLQQRGTFGEKPTPELAVEAMRVQAARMGAHAIILVAFGEEGMSWWSYHELRGHARAIRFR